MSARGLALATTVVALLLAAHPSPASAQSLTLEHALAAMRAQHPLLHAADADVEAADADAVHAGLWSNPVLDASYNPGVVQSSYDVAGYYTFGITQFFEVADTPGARARAARLSEDAARSDREALASELGIEVEQAFVDACSAAAERDLWRARVAQLEAVDGIVQTRVSAGAAPRYDAARFAIVLRAARTALGQSEAGLAAARGQLRAAIGPGASTLGGDPECAFEPPSLAPLDALLGRLTTRPDLVAARHRAAAADASTEAAQRAVMPGFAVRLGGNFGAAPGQVDLYAGVALPLPVIDHGQGSVRAAEQRAESVHRRVEALESASEARLRGLYDATVLARETETSTQASAAGSDEMLAEARAGYESGQFSVLELADAYAGWGDLQLLVIDASRDARHAELALGRELGRSLRTPSQEAR